MDIKGKIEELRAELHRHNYNYYVLNAPEISDFTLQDVLDADHAARDFVLETVNC